MFLVRSQEADGSAIEWTDATWNPVIHIAPTSPIDVVPPTVDGPALVPMRWGLIPSWWNGGVLSIAGLSDRWHSTDTGEIVLSRTMTITDANAFTPAIHNQMPVLLDRSDFEAWLSGAAGPEVLRPAVEDRLRMWPVSRRVNRTGGADDPALIEEIAT
ncbi:MAG TPA: SOS response-associated peptidase family protein [Xanthobacteraceae bacterium]|jgi:putative SOS response-associated peptidase YedK|nr:SOS response-associated peptidase family protein [Xanthobacteraceae bacterium]